MRCTLSIPCKIRIKQAIIKCCLYYVRWIKNFNLNKPRIPPLKKSLLSYLESGEAGEI